uniref:Saposin B-type domain-containing protein n=1 Tax=Panagrellus redivivus TaxID=6233 RepID=A0A7E5A1U8_PANRE
MKVLFVLFCLVAFTYAANPLCTMCTNIIDDVKASYNNDFSGVTADELKPKLEDECAKYASGIQATMCKSLVDQDAALLLSDLQAGKTSVEVCQKGNLC